VKKISGIYMIYNLQNHKRYVGSSVDCSFNSSGRWYFHRNLLRKNKHYNFYLQNAWNKYGEQNFIFETIEECEKEKLIEREQYWMDFYSSYEMNKGYNICRMAANTLGFRHSEETKKKLSNMFLGKRSGENGYWFGKHHSLETKMKIKENLPDIHGKNNPMFGKRHTEETKRKIGEKSKGRYFSPEARKKMSENNKGEKNDMAKLSWEKVREIRKRYKEESVTQDQLALEYGVTQGLIGHIVNYRIWKEDEVENDKSC